MQKVQGPVVFGMALTNFRKQTLVREPIAPPRISAAIAIGEALQFRHADRLLPLGFGGFGSLGCRRVDGQLIRVRGIESKGWRVELPKLDVQSARRLKAEGHLGLPPHKNFLDAKSR